MADPVDGVVYRAESFLAVGQVDRAETLLRDELAQRPDEAALLLTLTKVFEARRQWPQVLETGAATLEANPDSLTARMMIAWAAYQVGDLPLMREHLDVVLTHRPEHPTALMYLALHGVRDLTAAGKARTRELSRSSLEHSGGDPWNILMAAKIEIWLANSAEARRLVDDGLAQNPTYAPLLELKANLASTSIEESMDIVSGLLASSPGDPSLRARFDALVATRRRAVMTPLWLAPALLALAFIYTAGPFRVGAMVFVAALSFTVWGVRNAAIESLPPAYRAELASSAPWRVAIRAGGRTAATLTFVGGVLLAFGAVPFAWALALAPFGWAVARLAALGHERRLAVSADGEIALARPGTANGDTAGAVVGPTTRVLGRDRWRHAVFTPILLVPLCLVAVFPPDDFDVSNAARGALGVIAAVVGLTSLVAVAPWVRKPGSPGRTAWNAVRLAVPGVLLAIVLAVGIGNLAAVTAGWATDRPAPEREERTTPATIPPDYFDDLESPAPVPTFTFPEIDIPDIDIPTTRPDPSGG